MGTAEELREAWEREIGEPTDVAAAEHESDKTRTLDALIDDLTALRDVWQKR
jgi:hypothetical protein